MEVKVIHDWAEWLTLDQVKTLLRTGELVVPDTKGTLRLYIHSIDRVSANELLDRKTKQEKT